MGPLTVAASFALFALPGTSGNYWSTFFLPIVALGLGMAVTVAPLTTTVMNAVDVRHAGVASAINNAVSRVGGLLAIALMSVLVLHAFDDELDHRLAVMSLPPELVAALDAERVKLAAAEAPPNLGACDRVAIRQAVSIAFVTGFRYMAWVCAGLAVAGALAAATMINGGPPRKVRDVRRG